MQTITDDITGLLTAKKASTFHTKCVPKIMADTSIIPVFVSGQDIVDAANYFKNRIERKDGIDNDHLLNLFLLKNIAKQFHDTPMLDVDLDTYNWMRGNWDAYLGYMNDFNRELRRIDKRMILYVHDCKPTIDAHDGTYIKAALRASIANRSDLQNIRIKTFLTDEEMECRYIFTFTGYQQVLDTSLTIKD